MKMYKFIGLFKNVEGNQFQLTVRSFSFFEAFFLLTANAIKMGNHYQLYTITNEKNTVCYVSDIMKCNELLEIR